MYLHTWRRYIPIAYKEKQRKQRIAEMYKKVKELLPDFEPGDSSSDDSDH